jgi:murein L,D-transpeptidase YafK
MLPLLKDELLVIRIHKKKRTLEVWSKDRIVETFTIALGRNPEGRKMVEGDGRTPEGIYYICTKNDKSKYNLFLGLSYPGKEDAKRGLLSGIIYELTYYEIVRSIEENIRPPWNTPLGGEIGIHGGGTHSDWTQGCIAMDDTDIKKLWDYVKIGTPVEIYK